MTETIYNVDETLKERIRKRLARDSAEIEIREESWDFGFCDTCSYPEDGFSVYADGELVWPSENYLRSFGGVGFADDRGSIRGNRLSTYGYFDKWLSGVETVEEWDEVAESE